MTEPMMLQLIWDSPLGVAAILRGLGALLILSLVVGGAVATGVASVGSVLLALSYTQTGHTLGEPRWLLAGLLSVHLLTVGFWVAALGPLHRAARLPEGGRLLHQFGVVASVTVPVLILAGGTIAWLLTGSLSGLVSTAYGWTLMTKIAVTGGLLSLAALNKFRLVPALSTQSGPAAARLRRSIRLEAFCVLLILTSTATLTTVTTPPVNL